MMAYTRVKQPSFFSLVSEMMIDDGIEEKTYFIGSGFGFSAFPVLATLLNAMGLLNKPIGVQTISLAAVEDIVVWVILAIASAFSSGGSALQGLYTLLLTLGFIGIMVLIIRPILKWIHGYYLRRNEDTNVYLVVGCFLLLVVASFTTEVMGKRRNHHVLKQKFSNLRSFRYTRVFWCFHQWIMYTAHRRTT